MQRTQGRADSGTFLERDSRIDFAGELGEGGDGNRRVHKGVRVEKKSTGRDYQNLGAPRSNMET